MKGNSQLTKLDIASWGGFMIFATSAVIIAICLPEISNAFATSFSESGGSETARNLVILVVLLLAGALAQRWGKKRFLTLGQYLIAAGLLLASFSQSYPMLVLAIMITGIGGGFSEALLNPLIVDLHDRDAGKYLNISHAFYPVGVMTSALVFGELLTLGVSWRTIFRIAAVGGLLVAVLFTVLPFPPAKDDEETSLRPFAEILTLGGFWLFAIAIFLGGSIESALTFWSRSYVGAYLSDVPRAGAVAVVIFAAAMAVGRFLTAQLTSRMGMNGIMLGSAALGLGVSILIPLATNLYWFYALLALAGLATACFWPTIMAEADAHLNVNTTILFVLLACVGIIGVGMTPLVLGAIGDTSELRAGFAAIPVLFAGIIVVLGIERYLTHRVWRDEQAQPQEY